MMEEAASEVDLEGILFGHVEMREEVESTL